MKKISFVFQNHEFYKIYEYLYLLFLAFDRVRIVILMNKFFLKFCASFLSITKNKKIC